MNIFKKKETKNKFNSTGMICMLQGVIGNNQKVVNILEDSLVEENVDYETVIKKSIELLNDSITALNAGIRALT